MAYRPPHHKFWYEVGRQHVGTFRNKRNMESNPLLYLGSNRGLHGFIEDNPKLDKVLYQKALKLRSNLANELPRSTRDSRDRDRQTLKSSLGVRKEIPGGWYGDRSAFLIYDSSRGGRLRVVDYLSQFSGETLRERRKGNRVGNATKKRLTDRAIDKTAL